jgi:RNA polymerase sigma-70 factor (ECF subfamily)
MKKLSPEQLTRLYDDYAARLTLYARQWLKGPSAEDAVQEVFLRLASQGPGAADIEDELAVWLFRQLRSVASGERRSLKRRKRREQRVAQSRQPWFESSDADHLDAHAAEAALAELSAEQRETLVLRIWGGLTLAEMSTVLGEPVSTLFSRYRAGLAAVQKVMETSCQTKAE